MSHRPGQVVGLLPVLEELGEHGLPVGLQRVRRGGAQRPWGPIALVLQK